MTKADKAWRTDIEVRVAALETALKTLDQLLTTEERPSLQESSRELKAKLRALRREGGAT